MALRINPYFTFAGTAREAFAFYQSIFGGELQLATFAISTPPSNPTLKTWSCTANSAPNISPCKDRTVPPFTNPKNATTNMEISILGEGTDLETAKDWFQKLSDGATNVQPLNQAPWGAHFGSFTDKFGIAWMFNIEG